MEKQLPVMRNSLELSETIGEGLAFIFNQLEKGNMDGTLTILNDVIEAFYHIEMSISLLENMLDISSIVTMHPQFIQSLNDLISMYEQKDISNALEIVEMTVIPLFEQWQLELATCFQLHIAS